jgi:hypothetical protein
MIAVFFTQIPLLIVLDGPGLYPTELISPRGGKLVKGLNIMKSEDPPLPPYPDPPLPPYPGEPTDAEIEFCADFPLLCEDWHLPEIPEALQCVFDPPDRAGCTPTPDGLSGDCEPGAYCMLADVAWPRFECVAIEMEDKYWDQCYASYDCGPGQACFGGLCVGMCSGDEDEDLRPSTLCHYYAPLGVRLELLQCDPHADSCSYHLLSDAKCIPSSDGWGFVCVPTLEDEDETAWPTNVEVANVDFSGWEEDGYCTMHESCESGAMCISDGSCTAQCRYMCDVGSTNCAELPGYKCVSLDLYFYPDAGVCIPEWHT